MKITFDGVTRTLELDANASLKQSRAIQKFTGLTVADWTASLITRDIDAMAATATAAQAASTMAAVTDPKWIDNIAAAHWLMLAQNGEDPPPLDDDYDPDVLGFGLAFLTAVIDEAKAKAAEVPGKPGPKAPPGRSIPSSRRTSTPARKRPAARQEDARDLPPTGS